MLVSGGAFFGAAGSSAYSDTATRTILDLREKKLLQLPLLAPATTYSY